MSEFNKRDVLLFEKTYSISFFLLQIGIQFIQFFQKKKAVKLTLLLTKNLFLKFCKRSKH
jgi:hypothetical protein